MKKDRNFTRVRASMIRKNMYITKKQDHYLKYLFRRTGKTESIQMREALDLYFMELGL